MKFVLKQDDFLRRHKRFTITVKGKLEDFIQESFNDAVYEKNFRRMMNNHLKKINNILSDDDSSSESED